MRYAGILRSTDVFVLFVKLKYNKLIVLNKFALNVTVRLLRIEFTILLNKCLWLMANIKLVINSAQHRQKVISKIQDLMISKCMSRRNSLHLVFKRTKKKKNVTHNKASNAT